MEEKLQQACDLLDSFNIGWALFND
jgi:hypothetical protein